MTNPYKPNFEKFDEEEEIRIEILVAVLVAAVIAYLIYITG